MIERIVPTVKGVQATKYDAWLEKFTTPGHALFFTEEELGRQTASNVAKRMMLLDSKKGGRKFHSYFDVIEQMVVIRVRPQGEVPEKGEEEEKEELPKQETFQEMLARHNPDEDDPNYVTEPVTEQPTDFDLD